MHYAWQQIREKEELVNIQSKLAEGLKTNFTRTLAQISKILNPNFGLNDDLKTKKV
jgi:hypothetical protein